MVDPVNAICWYVTFLLCTTIHEAAHALVAMLGGDRTAYEGGQVTIDPLPHIRREPVGMVILPLVSLLLAGWPFGYASAPYNPYWAERYPKRAALMALAGPAANLATTAVAGILIRIGCAVGVFAFPAGLSTTSVVAGTGDGFWPVAALFISMVFSMGLVLAVFNMLPVPPLDGSGVLPLVLNQDWTARYRHAMSQPAFAWIGLVVAWNIFGPVFNPVFKLALRLLYPEWL